MITRANPLAYFAAPPQLTEKKGFVELRPAGILVVKDVSSRTVLPSGASVIKLFSFVAKDEAK